MTKAEFNTTNQCSRCNAACRIEGWNECWDLCTCECHRQIEEKNISVTVPSREEIKKEARSRWGDYFQMRDAFESGAEWMKSKLINKSPL